MKSIDINKCSDMIDKLNKEYSVDEIFWIIRNLTYDYIRYFGEDNKGVVYDGSYSDINVEQATRAQQSLSTSADIMRQVISSKREFEDSYLISKNI